MVELVSLNGYFGKTDLSLAYRMAVFPLYECPKSGRFLKTFPPAIGRNHAQVLL